MHSDPQTFQWLREGWHWQDHPKGSIHTLQLPPSLAGEGGCRKINICDQPEEETLKVPPPEEGVASRNPWNLLPFYTYNSSWHGARAEGWLGESWDTSEQPCAALAPAQLSHRRNHVPLVSQPWQQEGKLISQGPGVTDLELAFSELRLQCVLPEPCRCQGSEGTVQPGWQRWADTAGEEPCASPGSCWPLPCNPASMGSPHLPPSCRNWVQGLEHPLCPPPAPSVCPQSSGVGCAQLCSSTSPTAG